MSRSRFGLLTLGLGALLLGLMTMSTSAQAEKGAKWTVVNGKGELVEVKSGGLSPTISVKEVEGGEEIMLAEIAKIKVKKLCKKLQLVGAKLEGEGKTTSGAKVRFSECVVYLNNVLTKACEPKTKGSEKGTIESNAGKGLIVLHNGEGILLLEPVTGEEFMTLEFGEECAIGENIPLFGKLALNIAELKTELVTHLVSEFPALTDLFIINKTPEHKVVLDGSAILELTGEHLGLKWSGTPG